MSKLNVYGDTMVTTTGTHGADIAAQRMDDLDKKAVAFLLEAKSTLPVTLDIGCGYGTQGFRFSLLGAESHLFDIMDIAPQIEKFRSIFSSSNVYFHHGNINKTINSDFSGAVYLAYSQRTIHYLRYIDALSLCLKINDKMLPGARLYISASGINSELSKDYDGIGVPLDRRFSPLSSAVAEKHQIIEPVCLYSIEDMFCLAKESGFSIIDVWSSSFGNVKAILEKQND